MSESAYLWQKRLMRNLGVTRISFQSYHGNIAVWDVRLDNGDRLTINTHRLGTETGVLKQLATMLKPVAL